MGRGKSGSGSGMNIPYHVSEILETIFWVKKTLMRIRIRDLLDTESGMEKLRYRIRYKHPGSATLISRHGLSG
jgi:hypothetical protein